MHFDARLIASGARLLFPSDRDRAWSVAIPRFHIHTLGCKVNRAESETIAAALLAAGWQQAPAVEESDLIVLNTCTVTGEADAKNRKAIRTLLRKGNAPLLVTGCAVNVDANLYADMDARVVCEGDKSRIVERATEMLGIGVDGFAQLDGSALAQLRASDEADFRTRVDLKIQDGCDNACSYCIVHVARGPARSVPTAAVLEQARALADAGTGELVLVGIDLAAYHDGDTDLAALVKQLLTQTGIGRVRVSSVEPQSVTPALVEAFASSDGRLCRHLHLCLQSGCDRTLAEMNRHYDTRQFGQLVERLRAAAPSMALSTDVIVGFPGESDEDFEQSYRFIEGCGFMRLHVFRYSRRPGTPAATRDDQVDPKVKAERSNALLALSDRLMLADMERRLGTRERIVVEQPGLGTSESFHTVECDASIMPGALVELELYDIDDKSLRLLAR